jgi:DNA polymerase-1
MRHLIFDEADSYQVAVLTKLSSFNRLDLQRHYIQPLNQQGIASEQVIGFSLAYNDKGKAPAGFIKDYLAKLLPALQSVGVNTLYVCDGAYFKVLTKMSKAEPHYGYCLPCKIEGYEHMQVVLGMNHQALIYNPELQNKLDLSLKTLSDALLGSYQPLGANIIHSADYPETLDQIEAALEGLHQHPELSADIEAFSLAFNEAGIATIAFAWDQHNGVAFAVDYAAIPGATAAPYGKRIDNVRVKHMLCKFLRDYKGTLKWHNASYDLRSIICELWMKDLLDQEGLLKGLDTLTERFHDTKIIAYLATNSTAGNVLGLKQLAHEFAGNWAVDEINNVLAIEPDKLLQYNLVDCLSTNYVFDKYYPMMVEDNQEELYHSLMLPSLKVIIQMELTGMPMEDSQIAVARAELEAEQNAVLKVILGHPLIKPLEDKMTYEAWEKDFQDRKKKAKNPDKIMPKNRDGFPRCEFNPNSGPQLQRLLYEEMGLPVLDLTDTKQPAVGGDTLEKLVHHTEDAGEKAFLEAMVGYIGVSKILSAFIPSFEKGVVKADGKRYLHGGFNLGGTVSGRLSSSKPNLQQIPSGSAYGKLIKRCFSAAPGWVFCGADFNALEDRINTLLTRDPNKEKVFTQGYDSHCLRAFYFFPDKLPGVTEDVEGINSIKKLFPDIRQLAKSPAFALQYAGTWRTLVKNLGFEESLAKQIEANFHKMYAVSNQWVQGKIEEACHKGYAETAFGLRIRTPLLKQSYLGLSSTTNEAAAEGRTLGNAISGQSYGLLNNRACNEFMAKVWKSDYRHDIMPIAMIHDSVYLLVRDSLDIITWVNEELPKSMSWQELPELQHAEVKLGAELDVHYQGWHQPITLPNHASPAEILNICKREAKVFDEKVQKVLTS